MIAHRGWILREGGDRALGDAIAQGDLDAANLDPASRTLLDYVEVLTLRPDTIGLEQVQSRRDAGFTDAAIGDAVAVAAHYAIMNRIVDGLGAETPRGMDREIERLGLRK